MRNIVDVPVYLRLDNVSSLDNILTIFRIFDDFGYNIIMRRQLLGALYARVYMGANNLTITIPSGFT